MADQDVGKALLNVAATPAAESQAREQARQIAHRDRWGVRLLASLAVLLWLAAAVGVLFVVWLAIWYVFPKHRKLAADFAVMPVEQIVLVQQSNLIVWELCVEVIAGSFIALTLAALCTVWLVFWSRRATLREVNANLVAISEQLRLLRPSP